MRCKSKSNGDEGAVLLSTLLIMSLMAALAYAVMDETRYAIARAANTASQAQADWYALAAQDFAETVISDQIAQAPDAALNARLRAGEPLLLPLDGGLITLDVRDGSCLNLGNLGQGSTAEHFTALMSDLTIPNAVRLAAVTRDWIDPDTQIQGGAEDYTYLGRTPAYRTANAPMRSVMELRAVDGMTEDIYQTLRPFVCAREAGAEARINVNALTPPQLPLLAAIIGDAAVAGRIINERPLEGWTEAGLQESLLADQDLPGLDPAQLVYRPTSLYVEARIDYRGATRRRVMEFALSDTELKPLSTTANAEARRPRLVVEDGNEVAS